jgi:hypothetical protein
MPPTTNPTPNASSVPCHHDWLSATDVPADWAGWATVPDRDRQRMPTAISASPASQVSCPVLPGSLLGLSSVLLLYNTNLVRNSSRGIRASGTPRLLIGSFSFFTRL